MDIELRIQELVGVVGAFVPGQQLKKFITHIRFPRFKNIEPNTRIDFTFPLTALVGANGSGKTSVIHALYGAPKGKSTSDFWFTTAADPIQEGKGEPNRFIYGHYLDSQKGVVETRKARVSNKKNPDYWEPTKATTGDQMQLLPPLAKGQVVAGRSKDRWDPVERPVLYLNFRSELSAFDKFFFFGRFNKTKTIQSRQDRLRVGAKRLTKVMNSGMSSLLLYGHQTVSSNKLLTPEELDAVCNILGKQYVEARVVDHELYAHLGGTSVLFRTDKSQYTEAFAGSGELAVVSLVSKILSAEKYTLVLLDEPETSLHPGAQRRMLEFLLQQIRNRQLQIIYTTHSTAMVEGLPETALKVFSQMPSGKFSALNSANPLAAFYRLGAPMPEKVQVYVEDKLTKRVVELALSRIEENHRRAFEISVLPGGADAYFAHRIPTLMHREAREYVLLDGDKRPPNDVPDPDTIPAARDAELKALLTSLTGVKDIKLDADGGNDPDAIKRVYALQRRYLKFLHERVSFLPKSCAERIVLDAIGADAGDGSSAGAKIKLRDHLVQLNMPQDSNTIDVAAQTLLASHAAGNQDLQAIADWMRGLL